MEVTFSDKEVSAVEAALLEYQFSTEPGGVNHGDEDAEARYEELSAFAALLRPDGATITVSDHELDVLQHAVWELGFSIEDGGPYQGNKDVEAQVELLERLIGRAKATSSP